MSSTETRDNALKSGHQLDEYRIDCLLGQGAFGLTYQAWDSYLKTWVAIKEYLPREHAYRAGDNSVRPQRLLRPPGGGFFLAAQDSFPL